MNWSRFYYDFAAAYGTFWLAGAALALLTQSHINFGTFGMIGIPLLSAVYAFNKNPKPQQSPKATDEDEIWLLKRHIAKLESELNRD